MQDITNSGLWYLCQAAGNIKDGHSSKVIQVSSLSNIIPDVPLIISEIIS